MKRPIATGQGPLRFLFALLTLGGVAAPMTQAMAGTTSSSSLGGTAASVCTISGTSVTMTVVKSANNQVATFNPDSVTVFCNRSLGATLSARSTQVVRQGQGQGQNTTSDYTLSVNGWTTAAVTYTSAANNPAATTSSVGTPLSKTLTFTAANFTLPANDTYSATITLGLTGN